MILELSMCEADREKLGGPEWIPLDTDRLLDTAAKDLIRWEAESGYSIERALGEILTGVNPPAAAVLAMLWVARKQGGDLMGGQDDGGRPEPHARLAKQVRTMKVSYRQAAEPEPEPEPEGDAIPPAPTPAA